MAALWCSSTSLAEGDLSERARRRALEIANDADLRIWAPKNFGTERPRGEIMTEWHVLRSVDHPATGVWLGVVVLWMKFLPTGPGESPPVGYLLLGGLPEWHSNRLRSGPSCSSTARTSITPHGMPSVTRIPISIPSRWLPPSRIRMGGNFPRSASTRVFPTVKMTPSGTTSGPTSSKFTLITLSS